VIPRAGLDDVEKKIILSHAGARTAIPLSSILYAVSISTTLFRIDLFGVKKYITVNILGW
jgi:hypothetical protein